MRAVFIENRTVAGVLELDRLRRLSLDRDGLAQSLHFPPAAEIAVLIQVRGICVVDVEVLVVLAEDGEAPTSVLVMPDGDPGKDRLTPADHVPSGRREVNEVAERRSREGAGGIADHVRVARLRQSARDHPIVAPDLVASVPR